MEGGQPVGPHRRQPREPAVTVRRVRCGDLYVRISSLEGIHGRPFLLIPGMGVSATYFERLAVHLSRFGPAHSLRVILWCR